LEVIPFHSLVLCSREHLELFPQHERLSHGAITYDLVGDERRDLRTIAFAEMHHRTSLKLSLGQRVAVLADELCNTQHQQLAAVAANQGAAVIDLRSRKIDRLATSLPANIMGHLRGNWRGITVVGDLHGDLQAFDAATTWAEARKHFVWFLGDIIDYGAKTLATADAVYHLVMAGNAAMLLGNHERKIARWLDQKENGKTHIRVNDGNRVTIDALEALTPLARKQWIGRFRSLLAHSVLMQQLDDITLVHAAPHPSLWNGKPNPTLIEQFALYGEGDQAHGKFRRVHRWIDSVPNGQMVFVGHDVISEFPLLVTGAKGGRVVFLDTGCGTGGRLSTADLRFGPDGLHLECFNRIT